MPSVSHGTSKDAINPLHQRTQPWVTVDYITFYMRGTCNILPDPPPPDFDCLFDGWARYVMNLHLPRPNLHLSPPKPAPAPAQTCTCTCPNLHLPQPKPASAPA